jgi:hypothetical protein
VQHSLDHMTFTGPDSRPDISVCMGRIIVDDLSINGYCSNIQFCLTYKSMAECYTDLKNGEIETLSIFGQAHIVAVDDVNR